MEKIVTLFELCSSFCYTADVSKRVSFEYYLRALKLCFPSDPKKCHLSTEIISMLLELVQILQDEKLCTYTNLDFKGSRDIFNELLSVLESRHYHDSDVVEIISQALRLARADAKNQCGPQDPMNILSEFPFQLDQVKSAVYLKNWIHLLQLTKDGDVGFIIRVADVDPLCRPTQGTLSPLCYFASVLQRMKETGDQVDLYIDEERMDIFFRDIKHLFVNDRQTTIILLKMFSFKDISDAVLAEVYRLFLSKWCGTPQLLSVRHELQALESISQLLFVLPEGSLVLRLLRFWNNVFPNDLVFNALKRLLDLFIGLKTEGLDRQGVCLEERAERLFKFITQILPTSTLPFIHCWADFLCLLIFIFRTSFDTLPVVSNFVEKAVPSPSHQSPAALQEYQYRACDFLRWLSQQKYSEKIKENMAVLFLRCVDPTSGCNLLSVDLIKLLGLCKLLPLHCMETFVEEITSFSKHLEPHEIVTIRDFVFKVVASSKSLGNPKDIFSELSRTIKHLLAESQAPLIPNRAEAFKLISMLSEAPLSNQTVVRLLKVSRNSNDHLSCCLCYLQLVSSTFAIVKERATEHFKLLFAAMFETLNGNKNLCEIFVKHHCQFTASLSASCRSVAVLNIWSFVVAGLLSLGLFREKIDTKFCMPVLAKAEGFDSPFQALLLYFQLRSMFYGVIGLLTRCKAASRSFATPNQRVDNLVEALGTIVQSDVLTPENKLLLIDKVYELIISNRHMIGDTLRSALGNIIPVNQSISHENNASDHLEIQHILTILECPGMLQQLAKVPSTSSKSLHSVLCSSIPNPLSQDDVVDIYKCVAFLKDAKNEFLHHLLPLLGAVTKMCVTMTDVRCLLMEAEAMVRQLRPNLIPLSVLMFSHLVENKVTKEHRAAFMEQVALKWESDCDLLIYIDYGIPQLLWKACQRANSAEDKYEAIDQIHEIIVRSKEMEVHTQGGRNTDMNFVQRDIASRDLEWLVLDSYLSCEDVALCFHLSSCCRGVYDLKCFSSASGAKIKNGFIKLIPLQKNDPIKVSDDKSLSCVEHGSQDSCEDRVTLSEMLLSLLTPAVIAHKMILQLRRLFGDGIDLRDTAVQLWNSLFTKQCLPCPDASCKSSNHLPSFDDFVDVFLSVLENAPYLEVVLPWFVVPNNVQRSPHLDAARSWFSVNRSPHHFIQCSKVIRETCTWRGENVDKEGLLKIQAVVIETLQVLTGANTFQVSSPTCFRPLQPQLDCILCILQERFPFEVTADLLKLTQIDWQAAVAITSIASHWSSRKETATLLKGIHKLYSDGEMRVPNPLQREFVWRMLEACGRIYINSSKDLLEKLDCLINFQDPDELDYGLNRLPGWRKMMTAEGFSAQAIDTWCMFFLFTPRKNLSSRDVDAILDLSPSSLQLVAPVSQSIRQCIFPENFQIKLEQSEDTKDKLERLRLARLLGEFVHILELYKPNEASSDAAVTEIVVKACEELCKSYLENKPTGSQRGLGLQGSGQKNAGLQGSKTKISGLQGSIRLQNNALEFRVPDSSKNARGSGAPKQKFIGLQGSREPPFETRKPNKNLYKIHRQKLKDLFPNVFGQQSASDNQQADPHDYKEEVRVEVDEENDEESLVALSEKHEGASNLEVPNVSKKESRVEMPESSNESRVEVPGAQKEFKKEVAETPTNEQRPEAHEYERRIAVPKVEAPDAPAKEPKVEVPEAHEDSRVEVVEAHEDFRVEVPDAHDKEPRVEIAKTNEESRQEVPDTHDKESRVEVTDAPKNESKVEVTGAHEEFNRVEAHEDFKVEVHDAYEKAPSVDVVEAHETSSRVEVPKAHEESIVEVPDTREKEPRVEVLEAHEEPKVELMKAHETSNRVEEPDTQENESKVEVAEAREEFNRVEAERYPRKVVSETFRNETNVTLPATHENDSSLAVVELHENESKEAIPDVTKNDFQKEDPVGHRQGNPSSVLKRTEVYEPMLVLLRRWLSTIASKPTLASLTQDVVQLLLSQHSTKRGPFLLEEVHYKLQPHILHLPANQALISQLQAVGYNQRDPTAGNLDLWASSAVELACYLSKRESQGGKAFEKKLTKVLRSHWAEWKNLLLKLNINEISVDEANKVRTKDLFGFQASLKEMESQVASVKKTLGQAQSGDVERRVKQLIRQEQRLRSRIEKPYKSKTSGSETEKENSKSTKFVAVWENQFLENVKLCSERIPGCYAPNGFHSEKPVICALSVDNRILTIFKEDKPGRREEIENVEVKLFEPGMYVYGLHTSVHDYVTDELWAAFYKMLLEKRLVPSIVLCNESPGFEWIKEFVKPEKTYPCTWKWELHSEDYFEYLPVDAALWPFLYGITEFLTLTRENVASFRFSDLKDAKAVEKKKQQAKQIAFNLKTNQLLQRELHFLHQDEEMIESLARKLHFAVRKTVEGIVNEEQPTSETVNMGIDMERLAIIKCDKCKSVKKCCCKVKEALKSAEEYAALVLRICAGVQEAFCINRNLRHGNLLPAFLSIPLFFLRGKHNVFFVVVYGRDRAVPVSMFLPISMFVKLPWCT